MRSLKRLDAFTEEDMAEVLRINKLLRETTGPSKYAILNTPELRKWINDTSKMYSDKAFAKAYEDYPILR